MENVLIIITYYAIMFVVSGTIAAVRNVLIIITYYAIMFAVFGTVAAIRIAAKKNKGN